MSIGTLITEGIGSYGDIAHVITDGLDIGAPVVTPAKATILTQAFGTLNVLASPFVVTEGFNSGVVVVTPPAEPTAPPETGGGLDPGEGLLRAFKPLGLPPKAKRAEEPVLARKLDDIELVLQQETQEETHFAPIETMSMEAIHAEIGVLLRKQQDHALGVQVEEERLIILILALCA